MLHWSPFSYRCCSYLTDWKSPQANLLSRYVFGHLTAEERREPIADRDKASHLPRLVTCCTVIENGVRRRGMIGRVLPWLPEEAAACLASFSICSTNPLTFCLGSSRSCTITVFQGEVSCIEMPTPIVSDHVNARQTRV